MAYVQPAESLESSLWSKGQGGSWHKPPVQGQGKHPLEVGQTVFQQCRQVRCAEGGSEHIPGLSHPSAATLPRRYRAWPLKIMALGDLRTKPGVGRVLKEPKEIMEGAVCPAGTRMRNAKPPKFTACF